MVNFYYYEVRKEISAIIPNSEWDDGSLGPLFVRLAWHASGTYDKHSHTGGSNGSTMRLQTEADDPANAGLKYARDFLEPIKQQFPEISYADLWTLAGVVAIKDLGGPDVPWKSGRKDTNDESLVPPNGRLPDAEKGADHVESVFNRMGFTDRETVALIGAHSLGRCHLDRSGYDGPWTRTPDKFTNMFYHHLLKTEWKEVKLQNGNIQYVDSRSGEIIMLPADLALLDDRFKGHVQDFAKSKQAFFQEFAQAYGKLLELGVKRE